MAQVTHMDHFGKVPYVPQVPANLLQLDFIFMCNGYAMTNNFNQKMMTGFFHIAFCSVQQSLLISVLWLLPPYSV